MLTRSKYTFIGGTSSIYVDAGTLHAGSTFGAPVLDRIFFANTDSEGPESTTNGGILAAQRAVEGSGSAAGGKAPCRRKKAVAG